MPAGKAKKDKKSSSRTTTSYGKDLPVASLSSSQYHAGGEGMSEYDEDKIIGIQQSLEPLFKELKQKKAEKAVIEKQLKDLTSAQESSGDDRAALTAQSIKLEEEIESIERTIDPLLVERVQCVSELVKHHAQMRVDLFFLLCIALYNKKVDVIKGKTLLQHGKGSTKLGTAACHASLFPNIYTRSSKVKDSRTWLKFFQSQPAEESEDSWLPYYLASVSQNKSARDNQLLQEFGEESILDGTHFNDSLNITHELPSIVNNLDCILEGTYQRSDEVKLCLEVLNRVSQGVYTPDQGLNRFLEIMHNFFKGVDNKFSRTGVKTKESIPYPKAMRLVKDLQQEGTFRHCTGQCASKAQIDTLTQFPTAVERYVQEGFMSIFEMLTDGPLKHRYKEMQQEIFESHSSLDISNS